MIDFTRAKYSSYPFPYFVVEDVFEEEVLQKLLEEFPDVSQVESVMGGRRKIFGKNAESWLEGAKTWQKFYDFVNTQDTLDFIVKRYEEELRYWGSAIGKESRICDFITDIDWSVADDGYVREIHRDSRDRVWNFLIYLNDKSWSGGDFVIHSSDNVAYFKQHFWRKKLPVHRVIEAKRNLGVFFLSTPNSYHSVSKQFETKEPRQFIYGSITNKTTTFSRKISESAGFLDLTGDLCDEFRERFRRLLSRFSQ